jgi:hypothetical protein
MPNPELERLTTEATELIRRAVEIGIQMERARMRELLSADAAFAGSGSLTIRAEVRHRVRRPRGRASAGPIATTRKAIVDMSMGSDGVDTAGLLAFIKRRDPASSVTSKQVRGALKQLVNTGEARQPSRGRYLPMVKQTSPSEENSGDESPESFHLAAE